MCESLVSSWILPNVADYGHDLSLIGRNQFAPIRPHTPIKWLVRFSRFRCIRIAPDWICSKPFTRSSFTQTHGFVHFIIINRWRIYVRLSACSFCGFPKGNSTRQTTVVSNIYADTFFVGHVPGCCHHYYNLFEQLSQLEQPDPNRSRIFPFRHGRNEVGSPDRQKRCRRISSDV